MSFTTRKGGAFYKRSLAVLGVSALATAGFAPVASADNHVQNLDPACEGLTDDVGFADISFLPVATQEAINCLYNYDITTGRTPTQYAPVDEVKRYEMALFISRSIEYIESASDIDVVDRGDADPAGFDDLDGVPADAVAAINQLAELEIAQGKNADQYDPYGPINRRDMARFINRVQTNVVGVDYEADYSELFLDVPPTMAGAEDIYSIKGAGIVQGTGNDLYEPFLAVRRDHMAFFLMRHLADNIEAALLESLADGGQAPGEPNVTVTGAPELVQVVKDADEADIVEFVFDENIPGQALSEPVDGQYEDFALYDENGTIYHPTEAVINGDTVRARFAPFVVENAVRAGVLYGAAEDATGVANVEGDFALQAVAPDVDVAEEYAPQLVSVENYRLDDIIVGGEQEVLVDFVFESTAETDAEAAIEDADLQALWGDGAADPAEFNLVGSNGALYTAIDVVEYDAATNTFTVQLADDLVDVPESQIRRGYVADGESTLHLSEPYESTSGATVDPDLLSAEVLSTTATNYRVRYVFDEAISDVAAELVAAQFFIYNEDGDVLPADLVGRSAVAEDEATVAVAQFDITGFGTPVGAFVGEAAVTATDNVESPNAGANRVAETTLALPAPPEAEAPEPGVTALPDLVDVRVVQNSVTSNYTTTFEFDDSVTAVLADINFDLYDEAGTQFRVNGSLGTLSTDGTMVTFDRFDFDNEQQAAAVTAGVEDASPVPSTLRSVTEAQVNL